MREQGGRRLNVSGVLRHLGVSRSGYNTWKNRIKDFTYGIWRDSDPED